MALKPPKKFLNGSDTLKEFPIVTKYLFLKSARMSTFFIKKDITIFVDLDDIFIYYVERREYQHIEREEQKENTHWKQYNLIFSPYIITNSSHLNFIIIILFEEWSNITKNRALLFVLLYIKTNFLQAFYTKIMHFCRYFPISLSGIMFCAISQMDKCIAEFQLFKNHLTNIKFHGMRWDVRFSKCSVPWNRRFVNVVPFHVK